MESPFDMKRTTNKQMEHFAAKEQLKLKNFIQWLNKKGLLVENAYSSKEIIEAFLDGEELPLKDLEQVEKFDDIDLLS